jgi:hypothetical protein
MLCINSRRLHPSSPHSNQQTPSTNIWLSKTHCHTHHQSHIINTNHNLCYGAAIINYTTTGPQQMIELSSTFWIYYTSTLIRWCYSQQSQPHSIITEQLQKTSAGIIRNKLHESVKLLKLRPTLYILMLKAIILNIRWRPGRTVNKK